MMPRAEARGGMATRDRSVPRSSPSCGGRKAGLASAEFRLASPQMPRAEARGASLEEDVGRNSFTVTPVTATMGLECAIGYQELSGFSQRYIAFFERKGLVLQNTPLWFGCNRHTYFPSARISVSGNFLVQ
jgi:hypothetical protein